MNIDAKPVLALLFTTAAIAGCTVKFKDMRDVDNACKLVSAIKLDKEICVQDGSCISHNLRCEESSYASKVSPHTKKDWRAAYKRSFRKPNRQDRVNVSIDEYKRWGVGEARFFVISDNFNKPTKSSTTMYFYLNRQNKPRIVGATLFDAATGQVTEYEFKTSETHSRKPHMSSLPRDRELVKKRTFAANK